MIGWIKPLAVSIPGHNAMRGCGGLGGFPATRVVSIAVI
jgi:hypothetical protein